MRQILSLVIALSGAITFCNIAAAQKDTSTNAVYKAWDDFLARVKKDKKTDATTDAKLKSIREQWVAEINKSLSAKPFTEPWKEWKPQGQGKHGDIDLLPLMEEA